MATITSSSLCSDSAEEEIFISKCEESSNPPETTSSPSSSSDGATDNKASDAATASTRAFAASISVHPFKTRDEFLSAMMEDVTEWLNSLFGVSIKSSELMFHLETGTLLCRLANVLDRLMEKHDSEAADRRAPRTKDQQEPTSAIQRCSITTRPLVALSGSGAVVFRENAQRGSFQSRDNISNFLNWCRSRLKLTDTVLFETEDLVAGKNERNVILCLLEVARRGSKHGMPVPELIELESEIDAELGQESMAEDADEAERLRQEGSEDEDDEEEEERGAGAETEQVTTTSDLGRICDVDGSVEEYEGALTAASAGGRKELELSTCDATLSSRARLYLRIRDMLGMRARRPEVHRMKEMDVLTLDELVRRFLGNCRCPHQYPMIKISEGKYRIGENLMLIFVRLLRNHVMLRIGGGWETLADYLSRHDPCRAAEQHRKKEKPTQEHEETLPPTDETKPENDKNTEEKDQNTPAEDKNESAKDKNTPEKDEITPADDKNTPLQDQTASEKDENSSAENGTMPANDAATHESEEVRENSEEAEHKEKNLINVK